MWIVVYVTQAQAAADRLADTLYENKIISKVRRTCKDGGFEVLVPDAELSKAQELIFELD